MFRKRAFSHRGSFRKTNSGFRQKSFHSNNWFNQTTLTVPGGTTYPTPSVLDTILVDIPRVAAGSALIKDVRIARIVWSSVINCVLVESNVVMFYVPLEAIYQDTLTGANAPTHSATAFLCISEISPTQSPLVFPERILWKKMSQIPGGSNGTSGMSGFAFQPSQGIQNNGSELNPVVLKPRVKLDQDQCLVYRVEANNPSVNPAVLNILSLATFVMETRL